MSATEWTGQDFAAFLAKHSLTPEVVAEALDRNVVTVNNWAKREGPFAGAETSVMQLALLGMMADGQSLQRPSDAPPIDVTVRFWPDGRTEVAKVQLARVPRPPRGEGKRPVREFVEVP